MPKGFAWSKFSALEQDGKELAGEGQKADMLAMLWELPDVASAAKGLAQHFVRQIFERHA